MAGVTAPPAKLKVIGAGTGGLDEMREKVNDGTVQFALCRFAFGRGTFKRNKLIFMTINGGAWVARSFVGGARGGGPRGARAALRLARCSRPSAFALSLLHAFIPSPPASFSQRMRRR